ncbi:MAG TPA: DUF1697 domain-containing protein [Methanocella sp.]|nr:DUF1697 domain-containing protein [Methanocella sp.]
MMRYVAFLRGVNVGGHTMVRTSDICQRLASKGFKNVRGYKQSGNIVFDTEEEDPERISGEVRGAIFGLIGKDVGVFLRTLDDVREMVRSDPFRDVRGRDVKTFVSFLSRELREVPGLPIKSPEGDSEIIAIRGREVYGIGYPKDGRYGESYGKMVDRLGGGPATARNWNTIVGIAALPGP